MEPYPLPPFGSHNPSLAGLPNPAPNSELHHQPSPQFPDLSTTWPANNFLAPQPIPQPALEPGSSNPTQFYPDPTPGNQVGIGAMWTDQILGVASVRGQSQRALTVVKGTEENSLIKLVLALLTCAEAIHFGYVQLASNLLDQMTNDLVPHVNTDIGMGKVASYFIEALTRRVYSPARCPGPFVDYDYEVLYRHFYVAGPYMKFCHFAANQAIMDAFDGHDYVHIIDFGLINGLQWPSLIQALAWRPTVPTFLRLTGIGLPSETGSNSLLEVGSQLSRLARSLNLPFAFQAVSSSRLEDIESLIETNPKETVAVNSVFHLHKLIASDIDPVLNLFRNLNPKIVTVVEQEVNHNQPEFLPRFKEALSFYSAMFDSLESYTVAEPGKAQLDMAQPGAVPGKALAELYLQREINNILCCEGLDRVERHEPLRQWRVRMGRAGFRQKVFSYNAFTHATTLLSIYSPEGYGVEEREGCLRLGWHRRPLITASAWEVGTTPIVTSSVILDGSSSSSSSSY